MFKVAKIFAAICFLHLLFLPVSYADAPNANQRYFYIGGDVGIVDPVVKKFCHKESNTNISLKKSKMYSGKIGYNFYPQMSVEFSATYQPTYRLHYILPEQNLANGLIIPKTPGNTKVRTDIYMLNLVYELASAKGFTPFVLLGAGIAKVKVKAATSKWEAMNQEYFQLQKTKTNCFIWQVGVGFAKEIVHNFSINLIAKLQVAHGIKINYNTLNLASQKFIPAKPIKKTIGTGEFGIGFTYKLPI